MGDGGCNQALVATGMLHPLTLDVLLTSSYLTNLLLATFAQG